MIIKLTPSVVYPEFFTSSWNPSSSLYNSQTTQSLAHSSAYPRTPAIYTPDSERLKPFL